MRNRTLLYITIQPEVIILLHQRLNNNMFKRCSVSVGKV